MMRAIPFLAALLLFACASTVAMAPDAADVEAKRFASPADGMAHIYVVRPGGHAGDTLPLAIHLDGEVVGSLGPGTYRVLAVAPGRHRIALRTIESQPFVLFEVAAGEVTFVEAHTRMSFLFGAAGGQCNITRIADRVGRYMVGQAKMARWVE